MFETRVLRRIFWHKRDEVKGKWGKLHSEELNDLYSLSNTIRVIKSGRMRCPGHVAGVGERSGAYRVLVRKPEGKRPLGRPMHRWKGNIKMDLQEVRWGGGWKMDWIDLAHYWDSWQAHVNMIMNFQVP